VEEMTREKKTKIRTPPDKRAGWDLGYKKKGGKPRRKLYNWGSLVKTKKGAKFAQSQEGKKKNKNWPEARVKGPGQPGNARQKQPSLSAIPCPKKAQGAPRVPVR